MKVCTSEEATAFNCYRMPKKCCGAQCMAWEETGDNGLCGALPKSEVMQHAVGQFGGMPIFEPYPLNNDPPSSPYNVLEVVQVSATLLDHVSIDASHGDAPYEPTTSQDLGQSHTPAPKHNKHKGGR